VIGVSLEAGGEYVYPSLETVNSGKYPIARDLYMYTNGQPQGILAVYLDWIFSTEARQIVVDLGFVPINP
jgi:phosphate transport system substrate-binding protein